MYRAEGLGVPTSVEVATAEYRYDSDKITQFMDECTTRCVGQAERTTTLHARYQAWCRENGCYLRL